MDLNLQNGARVNDTFCPVNRPQQALPMAFLSVCNIIKTLKQQETNSFLSLSLQVDNKGYLILVLFTLMCINMNICLNIFLKY